LLTGEVGRAGVLAAVAHDAGEGVEKLRLAQMLQPRHAELLALVVGEVERIERAQGSAFGP